MEPGLVVFGQSGSFTETPLHALAASGLRIDWVVEGLPRQARPVLRRYPAHRRGFNAKPASSLIRTAHELGVDAVCTDDVGRLCAELTRRKPALFVVLGYPQLLPSALVQLPRRGGLNVHPGRLPEQRGPAPIFWALRRGESLGCTIHRLTAEEDAGEIVHEIPIQVPDGAVYGTILRTMAQEIRAPLIRAVRDMLRGELVCSPQPSHGVHRDPMPRFRDGRLNPDRNVHELFRFVSACAPRYSLYVESAKDRYFIAAALGVHENLRIPGEYLLDGDRLLWTCEGGVLELLLKPDGALFSADF